MYKKSSWTNGLTKETDERIKKSAEKGSKTKKRMFKEGKLNAWNKNKKGIPSPLKNKTYEEIFGDEKAKEIKKKIGLKSKGRIWSEERRIKMSERMKGEKNPMYGKKLIPWNKDKKLHYEVWNKNLTKETDERLKRMGEKTSKRIKNKTYEEMYGIEKAKELKQKVRLQTKGKTYEEMYGEDKAKELIEKRSEKMKEINPMGNLKSRKKMGETIRRLFKEGKICTEKVNVPKNILYKKYVIEKKSSYEIAKELNIGSHFLYNRLKKFGILRRERKEQILPLKNSKIEIKIQDFLKDLR